MKMKKMTGEPASSAESMNPHKMRREKGFVQGKPFTSSGGSTKMPGGKNMKVKKTRKY